MRRYHLEWITGVVIVVVTTAVFWRVLVSDFVTWDDDINIYKNDLIRGLDTGHVARMFLDVEQAMRYKPLTWLAWAIIYACDGLNPFGYHFANLLLHCANAVLVFVVIRRLLLSGGGDVRDAKTREYLSISAGLGALFWAIHPLRVEPVAWATGLPYDLSLFFMLVSFVCYLGMSCPEQPNTRQRFYYWASILNFIFSLLSYPVIIGYSVVLMVVDVFPLKRISLSRGRWWDAKARQIWLEKVPFLAVTCLFIGIALYGRIKPTGIWHEAVPIESFSLASRTMQAFYIWAYYFWKPWLSTNLSPVYTTLISFEPNDRPFVLGIALILGISLLVWRKRREWPSAFALWICHLALLVPVLGLTEHPHFPSDRYGIVVGILWPILIAAGLFRFGAGGRAKETAVTASVVVLAVLGWMSRSQVRIWSNDIALFSYTAEETAGSQMGEVMRARLAVAQLHHGQFAAALENLQRLLEVRPDDADYHHNAAFALFHLDRFPESVIHYQEALRLSPFDAGLHNATGIALAAAGNLSEAERQFNEALRIDPRLADAQFNLGVILSRQGRTNEATVCFEKARALHLSPIK